MVGGDEHQCSNLDRCLACESVAEKHMPQAHIWPQLDLCIMSMPDSSDRFPSSLRKIKLTTWIIENSPKPIQHSKKFTESTHSRKIQFPHEKAVKTTKHKLWLHRMLTEQSLGKIKLNNPACPEAGRIIQQVQALLKPGTVSTEQGDKPAR